MSIRLPSLFCHFFLILVVFEIGASARRSIRYVPVSTETLEEASTIASTDKKTTTYRKLLNVTELYLRDAEVFFSNSTKKLEENVQHYTRSLENIISPDSSSDSNIIPIPKSEASLIYSTVKTLKDDLWHWKVFELYLRSNLSLIENLILDFSVDSNANLDEDYANPNEYNNPKEERVPCYDGSCVYKVIRSSRNGYIEAYVRTKSRSVLNEVQKLTQLIEDGLKNSCRDLERNTLKFVRVMEDIVGHLRTSSLSWKQPSNVQFDEMLRTSYILKRLVVNRVKSLKDSLQSKLHDVEDAIENAVCATLSDDSSVIEAVKSTAEEY